MPKRLRLLVVVAYVSFLGTCTRSFPIQPFRTRSTRNFSKHANTWGVSRGQRCCAELFKFGNWPDLSQLARRRFGKTKTLITHGLRLSQWTGSQTMAWTLPGGLARELRGVSIDMHERLKMMSIYRTLTLLPITSISTFP